MPDSIQESIEILSKAFNVPIYVSDSEGNRRLGTKIPFFCELAEKKGRVLCQECRKQWQNLKEPEITACHAGLTNIVVPLHTPAGPSGVLVASSMKQGQLSFAEPAKNIGIDVEDLIDESSKLPSLPEEQLMALAAGIASLGKIIPEMAWQSHTAEKQITYYRSLAEFARLLFSGKENLNEIVEFLRRVFELEDCALLLDAKTYRAKREGAEQLSSAERVIWAQALNTRSPICISNLASDFLTQSPDLPHWSAIALPLEKEQVLGVLILYKNDTHWPKELEELTPFALLLTQALATSLLLKQAQESAMTDSLTGLYNKRYFLEALKNEVARAARFSRPTSLIILDIDDFKHYNDTYGHPDGDVLLKEIGKLLKEQVGAIDIPCRFGGEEFVIVLPETKPDHAFLMGEKIRIAVEQHTFPNRKVTVSVGLITCTNSSASPDTMLKESDKALYKSKKTGKNKTMQVIMVDKNLAPIEGEVTREQVSR